MARILSFEHYLLRGSRLPLHEADETSRLVDSRAIPLTVRQITHRSAMLANLERIKAARIAHESCRDSDPRRGRADPKPESCH